MSIRSMVTKLAIAFAAKKGIDAFRGMGGISGAKAAMQNKASSSTGGLGDIMNTLGLGNSSAATTGAAGGSIGAVIGSLATAFGGQGANDVSRKDLEDDFAQTEPLDDADANPVLRAMVQMARADGSIDDTEQKALFDILDDATADEKAVLTSAMREPVNAQELAQDTPPNARKEVYAAALLISKPDVTATEKSFLQDLARGLGFEQADLDRLHIAMGKSRLMLG